MNLFCCCIALALKSVSLVTFSPLKPTYATSNLIQNGTGTKDHFVDELPPNVFIYLIISCCPKNRLFFLQQVTGSHMFSSAIWDKSAPINLSKTALSMSVMKSLHVHYWKGTIHFMFKCVNFSFEQNFSFPLEICVDEEIGKKLS